MLSDLPDWKDKEIEQLKAKLSNAREALEIIGFNLRVHTDLKTELSMRIKAANEALASLDSDNAASGEDKT